MARGKGRKEISDFSMGMDSSSFPGVISNENSLPSLLQNCRVRDAGRVLRRNGNQFTSVQEFAGGSTGISASFHHKGAEAGVSDLGQPILYKAGSTVDKFYKTDGAGSAEAIVKDYDATPADATLDGNTYNMVKDSNDKVYAPSDSAALDYVVSGALSGAIFDYDTVLDKYVARNWGIRAPQNAITASDLLAGSNPIDPPVNGGWIFYYTYIRKVGTEIIAESAPSPASNRLTYAAASRWQLAFAAGSDSADPQVTGIRIYATADGGSSATAAFVADFTNLDPAGDTTIIDSTEPRTISILANTFDYYPMNPYISAVSESPKPAKGNIIAIYKDQILVGGADDYVYYTDQTAVPKFKTLFHYLSFADFYDTVTAIFIHASDIVICTRNTTWRIVDGDWTEGKRQESTGIGVIAHNSVAYDNITKRTVALTNKGVRAWDGTQWSEDLSYRIRGDIVTSTVKDGANDHASAWKATAKIINREYFLSVMGGADDGSEPDTARIFVGFLHDNGYIAWTIDNHLTDFFVQGTIFSGVGDSVPSTYQEIPFALIRYGEAGSQTNRMIRFEQAADYDFGDDRIEMKIQIPRIIHGSPQNNIRLRRARVVTTLSNSFSGTGETYYMEARVKGDNGRVYQKKKLIQAKAVLSLPQFKWGSGSRWGSNNNPAGVSPYYEATILDTHFDSSHGSSFMDVLFRYDRTVQVEINSISIMYLFRDRAVVDEVQ